jgi:hypothetical protein
MASVEIVDETLVVVDRGMVAAVVADRRRWREWWPDLDVVVVLDRGQEGMRWSIRGPLVGFTDVRLVLDPAGVVVQYSLVADPTVPGTTTTARAVPDSPRGQRELATLRQRHLVAWKAVVWALKESLESSSGASSRGASAAGAAPAGPAA